MHVRLHGNACRSQEAVLLLAPDMLPCWALMAFSGGASWGFGEDAINEDDDCKCFWVALRWCCELDWAVVED